MLARRWSNRSGTAAERGGPSRPSPGPPAHAASNAGSRQRTGGPERSPRLAGALVDAHAGSHGGDLLEVGGTGPARVSARPDRRMARITSGTSTEETVAACIEEVRKTKREIDCRLLVAAVLNLPRARFLMEQRVRPTSSGRVAWAAGSWPGRRTIPKVRSQACCTPTPSACVRRCDWRFVRPDGSRTARCTAGPHRGQR